jgi:hypothetical protein
LWILVGGVFIVANDVWLGGGGGGGAERRAREIVGNFLSNIILRRLIVAHPWRIRFLSLVILRLIKYLDRLHVCVFVTNSNYFMNNTLGRVSVRACRVLSFFREENLYCIGFFFLILCLLVYFFMEFFTCQYLRKNKRFYCNPRKLHSINYLVFLLLICEIYTICFHLNLFNSPLTKIVVWLQWSKKRTYSHQFFLVLSCARVFLSNEFHWTSKNMDKLTFMTTYLNSTNQSQISYHSLCRGQDFEIIQ